ncbi:MAG: hypothetical protein JO067_04205 [Cupriavidus sp.]|nr:hypothetical protein [Cupriavidus sp.]
MTAKRNTEGTLKDGQPPAAAGTGLDDNQGPVEPTMRKVEEDPIPDGGGSGLDPVQNHPQPLSREKKDR